MQTQPPSQIDKSGERVLDTDCTKVLYEAGCNRFFKNFLSEIMIRNLNKNVDIRTR
jgi:hypothetical protein